MPKQERKKLLAVLDDLFFAVKINEAAKRAGMEVEFVKSAQDLFEKAKSQPSVIIFDLNYSAVEPLNLLSQLKASSELKNISCIGYVSHIQGELKQKAHETGCDVVLARSAFSQNLPQILKRHAGTL
jgi:PleD family two-component response regulator